MANNIEYKCPSCGAVLHFDSTLQKMKCPYCDTVIDTETQFIKDEVLDSPSTFSVKESENLGIYHCDSCGAEVITDETTAATHCPYCDNVIILTGNLSGQLKPDIVIPFNYDKESAKQALKEHFKDKKFLPKVFSSENHLDEIKGIYIPFFIFDSDVVASANYSATKVRMWTDTVFEYTETSYYNVDRKGSMTFNALPVDALDSIPNDLTESLEVFDFTKAVPFKTAFLSGYFANRYDVSADECIKRAKERISKSCIEALEHSVEGYSSVTQKSSSIQLVNTKTQYGLFPVWILNTTWCGNKYTFAMNGESGKFVGNLPIDKGIYWKYRLLYGGGIAAVVFALIQLLFGGGVL